MYKIIMNKNLRMSKISFFGLDIGFICRKSITRGNGRKKYDIRALIPESSYVLLLTGFELKKVNQFIKPGNSNMNEVKIVCKKTERERCKIFMYALRICF
jgi:hypothetical protein